MLQSGNNRNSVVLAQKQAFKTMQKKKLTHLHMETEVPKTH